MLLWWHVCFTQNICNSKGSEDSDFYSAHYEPDSVLSVLPPLIWFIYSGNQEVTNCPQAAWLENSNIRLWSAPFADLSVLREEIRVAQWDADYEMSIISKPHLRRTDL